MIDITTLGMDCEANGNTRVTTWAKCTTAEDVDDLILWLGLARDVMVQWQDIRSRRLIASTGANVTSIKKKGE